MKAKARNTFALSTSLTSPRRPRTRAQCSASRKEKRARRSVLARVIRSVSSAMSVTLPQPREWNSPSVLSRTITRSIPRARGAASATGTPGIARTGRTPA
jgi:hypothetical protein